ncbi:Isoniazid-inducible protein iniC, partial [Mycobacterium tuberculosis]
PLLARFGLFGLRLSLAVLAAGVPASPGLAADLLARRGLVALRPVLAPPFAPRSALLPAPPALVSLRRFVPPP